MFNTKKLMAKCVVKELNLEIRRYQDRHADAYVKASKAENEDDKERADQQFDLTLAKLEALYELRGELRAKGYM